jgi:hypothetical protein
MLTSVEGNADRRSQAFITELETPARTESKRMTNNNTPQVSRIDLANHCAAFPGLSLLSLSLFFVHNQYYIKVELSVQYLIFFISSLLAIRITLNSIS